jgi:alpha-beta hydrolase superfamily lysophospholipase
VLDSTLQAVKTVADPTWIVGPGAPIFGWVHRPADGRARGAVVLCPPLGREHMSSYRALRLLAERLAGVGILAVRFDYTGTGDSAGGAAEAGQVDAWVGSVAGAADFATGAVCGPVILVGLRMGATLAVEAISQIERLEALVLWDPCPSPAVFLREQHLLHRLSSGLGKSAGDSGWLETPGMAFSDDTVDDLRALQWSGGTATALGEEMSNGVGVLLLSRADEPLNPSLRELSEHRDVEHSEVTGQAALLETSTSPGMVIESTLDSITTYVSRRFPREASTCDVTISTTASLPYGGQEVVERAVHLGSGELFGIVTEKRAAPACPWVLLLTVASHHHVGPSRQWVELARRWAASGARVLRFDVSGVGDSGDFSGQMVYTRRSVSDVVEAAKAISPDAPGDVILVGMCSGAWAASLAGRELAARAVYLVNQDQWHEGDGHPSEGAAGDGKTAPSVMLHRLRSRGVAVTVIVGPEDDEGLRAALLPSEAKELFEPAETGGESDVRFVRIDELDHDLFTRAACQNVAEQLTPLVLGSCVSAASSAAVEARESIKSTQPVKRASE